MAWIVLFSPSARVDSVLRLPLASVLGGCTNPRNGMLQSLPLALKLCSTTFMRLITPA